MASVTKPKILLVTNIPAPYRTPIFDRVSERFPGLTVAYCKASEPDRKWGAAGFSHRAVFLDSFTISLKGRFVHLGLNIVPKLFRLNPDIVITTQYYPACLLAFLWAKLRRRPHICMYDGWEGFDRHLTRAHRLLRALFYRGSDAFIGVSSHTRRLFESYGADLAGRWFWSPLCVDNAAFAGGGEKRYDLMLSGRIVDVKLPEFTAAVIVEVARRRPGTRVLIIGSGDRLDYLLGALKAAGVEVHCPGFAQPAELPGWYAQARLLLLPSNGDCWGLVANEAMAAGLPVVTTPWAGVKDDLVRHGENGYVLPEDRDAWADAIEGLLADPERYRAFSERSRAAVAAYTFDAAAHGIGEAVARCLPAPGPAP